MLTRVLDAADRFTPMTTQERHAATQEMESEELIFPIPL